MEIEDTYRLVGTTVAEKYVVERVAGSGGFATVYRARHLLWDRPVALKVFKVAEGVSVELRKKMMADFNKEGALLAELSERSSAFAQARDIGMMTCANGEMVPYMVLEWLEGRTLDAVIEEDVDAQRTYSFEQAFQILAPALEALALAHSRGIAHRDVKPANLFVVTEPNGTSTLKLLDFGIAKVVQDARKEAGEFSKTTGQLTSFTPLYGAPEQFSRSLGATGPWTDVFAMALIFVELMTGSTPLYGDDFAQVAFASTNPNERPTPRARGAEVSDAVEAVFARAVAIAPQERWASCGEFYQALLDAAPQLQGRRSMVLPMSVPLPAGRDASDKRPVALSQPVNLRDTVDAPKSSKLGVVIGAMAVLAAAGGGALYFFGRTTPNPPPTQGTEVSSGASVAAPSVASVASSVASAAPVAEQKRCPRPDMAYVEGGRMFMGSEAGDEAPIHAVQLDAYCIDRHEVTVERYVACTAKSGCLRSDPSNNEAAYLSKAEIEIFNSLCSLDGAKSGSDIPEGRAKLPINCIDYEHAAAFCAFDNGRLPTEAEWEHAARGSDQRTYPWDDSEPDPKRLNACDDECSAWFKQNPGAGKPAKQMYEGTDGFATLAPVGSFPRGASPFGVEDLAGNVFEWVADWYGAYTPTNEKNPPLNPEGPKRGRDRVARGGAWNSEDKSWMRPSFRMHFPPKARSHGVGFRCVSAPLEGS